MSTYLKLERMDEWKVYYHLLEVKIADENHEKLLNLEFFGFQLRGRLREKEKERKK